MDIDYWPSACIGLYWLVKLFTNWSQLLPRGQSLCSPRSCFEKKYWKPLKGGRAKTSESFQPRSPPIFTRKMIWEGWKEMWECERDEDILDSGRLLASQSRDDQSPGDAPSRGQVDLLITLKVTMLRKKWSRGVREGSCKVWGGICQGLFSA